MARSYLGPRSIRLKPLLFAALWRSALALPSYNPNRPYETENFDPAEADPLGNITCVGSGYGMELPILGDFDPNQVSMQKLCAKPQYNGGARGQHAGGFCSWPPGQTHDGSNHTGQVGFDLSRGAEANPSLQNPRITLGCFYRCFCTAGLTDLSTQPKSVYPLFATRYRPSVLSYELQLDVQDDFTTPREMKKGKLHRQDVRTTRPESYTQIHEALGYTHLGSGDLTVSLDPRNELKCTGALPRFALPAPFNLSDFSDNQELCAMQLSGGNVAANAGGFCYRSDIDTSPKYTVWFSDEMTPRLDWSWGGGNYFAAAAIRYHCWKNCACSAGSTIKAAYSPFWEFVYNFRLSERSDGSIDVTSGPTDEQQTKGIIQVLPAQNGAGSPSGTCGASGMEFCPQVWDESVFGPIPRAPPNVTDIIRAPDSSNTSSTVCGSQCSRASDCGSTDGEYSCSCAIPSTDDARTLGLDPVYPTAFCMVLFAAAEAITSLNGRSIASSSMVDERDIPHTCRCNEIHVGDECCALNVQGRSPLQLAGMENVT